MIDGLKPYGEYRETGSRWNPVCPQHWTIKSLRSLLKNRTERNRPELPLLSVARERGVFVRSLTDSDENHNVIPDDLSNYKVALAGDLVINKMKAWQGSMGIAPVDGIVSPAYYVYGLAIADANYAQLLLRSRPYVAHFAATSDGVRVGQWDLSTAGMKEIPVPLPPPDEQAAIVRFLTWAHRRLDRVVANKRRTIALLNEQKQAIIHRAVTRGLAPHAKLKPSGIPWLGEIPEGWLISPIKKLLSRMDYGTSESSVDNGRYRVLTMGHIKDGKVLVPERGGLNTITDALVLQKDDLLFNRTNSPDLVGKVGRFEGSPELKVTFASYLVRLRVASAHDPIWLNLLLNSSSFWGYARSQALVSLHQANLSSKRYGLLLVPVPGSHEEEKAIANSIMKETTTLDSTISRLEQEIRLLVEYRTRLTADVVTGQLDVRQAAAGLPDEEPVEVSLDDDLADEEEA